MFFIKVNSLDVSKLDLKDKFQVVWCEWFVNDGYIVNDKGLVVCKIYGYEKVIKIWYVIMMFIYDFVELGFILIDKVNQMNNNWFCENIWVINFCGEQLLLAYGSCLLGLVNLICYVCNLFIDKVYFDWDEY